MPSMDFMGSGASQQISLNVESDPPAPKRGSSGGTTCTGTLCGK